MATNHHHHHRHKHHHGRPPWHAFALVSLLISLALEFLPTSAALDRSAAVPATFARRLFPAYMSLSALFVVRAASAAFIFALSLHSLVAAHQPGQATTIVSPYLSHSQLQRGASISLRGFYCQAPFTVWAWNLLGLSFAVNAYLTYRVMNDDDNDDDISPWLLRAGIVLFETAAPLTLLVSAVVKYAIWPQALRVGTGTSVLKSFRALSYHNVNVALAMAEVTLLGGLPVRYQDVSLAILFGCTYVVFAWLIRHQWNPAAGPQFLYFFLDTTLGITTTMALAALCLVLVAFYAIFCLLDVLLLEYLGGSLAAHVLSWALVCAMVGRIRD